jgi:hypothetical protein
MVPVQELAALSGANEASLYSCHIQFAFHISSLRRFFCNTDSCQEEFLQYLYLPFER